MGINIKDNVKILLEVAAKCGGFTRDLAEETGVKYRRLKQLEQLNYIDKPHIFNIKEDGNIKTKYVYTLSDEGEKFLKQQSVCTAVAYLNGYEHTKASEQVYLDLRKMYEPEEILNEAEQRYHFFKDEIDDMDKKKIDYSIVDFCIFKENEELEFIEVTTKNYRQRDFVRKEHYCEYFNKTPDYR